MFALTIHLGQVKHYSKHKSEAGANSALAEFLESKHYYLNERGPGQIFCLIEDPKPGQRGRRVGLYEIEKIA